MTTERPNDEGWIPSATTLRDLLEIAPAQWVERLASLAVREGLFADTPTWHELDTETSALNRAYSLAERRRLAGHRPSVDLPLMWRQIIAVNAQDRYGIEVFLQLDPHADGGLEAILAGRRKILLTIPLAGVAHPVAPERIKQLIEQIASADYKRIREWGDADMVWPLSPDEWTPEGFQKLAEEILREWVNTKLGDEEEDVYLGSLDDWANAVAAQIAVEEGFQRGPCPRCGRLRWYIKEPKLKGRPPLIFTYCPPCVEAIKREKAAQLKRRQRASKQVDGRTVHKKP